MEEKNINSIDKRVNLNIIRYANCWEDADILLKAITPKKNGNYLSIASAGDNSFALLSKSPSFVLAIDLNPTQLACVELKKATFKNLEYEEILQFLGIHKSEKRKKYYSQLKKDISSESCKFWDANLHLIEKGMIHIGKFENYFKLFRTWCLPLIHSQKKINYLLEKKSKNERLSFYSKKWNNKRWKLLFNFFFSKKVMGKLGRDPEFFKYVKTDVAKNILSRVEYGLSNLPTENNPYLEYILKGNFQKSLPFYLRRENFENIRKNLDKLILFKGDLQAAFKAYPKMKFDGFNLSDIFEYMSYKQYSKELKNIIKASKKGAKIAFWNMLANRKDVLSLKNEILFLDEKADTLHKEDKAFFYQSFILGIVQ